MDGVVRVAAGGGSPGNGVALQLHQLDERLRTAVLDLGARLLDGLDLLGVSGVMAHTRVPGPATLMGPWRYSPLA